MIWVRMYPGHSTETPIPAERVHRAGLPKARQRHICSRYTGCCPGTAAPRWRPWTRLSALSMLFDQRAGNLDSPDDRHQIDAERPIPSGVGPCAVGSAAAHSSIVDENVHLAIAGDRGVGRRLSSALSETSALTPSTSALVRFSPSTAFASAASSMSQSMTLTPACARAAAMPSPIPDAAPVTNAVFPPGPSFGFPRSKAFHAKSPTTYRGPP